MTRVCIYHRYEYPDLKSRLKTYFLKLAGFIKIINGKPVYLTLYGGEVWTNDMDIIIGKDKDWNYHLEIQHGIFCGQRQILIIKEWRHY